MTRQLNNEAELRALLSDVPALLVYFFSPSCGVCQALKPRVINLLEEEFPRILFVEVDCTENPALPAGFQIFSVPTVLLFLEGHESLRLVRNFHLGELRDVLARPYALLFGDKA